MYMYLLMVRADSPYLKEDGGERLAFHAWTLSDERLYTTLNGPRDIWRIPDVLTLLSGPLSLRPPLRFYTLSPGDHVFGNICGFAMGTPC